MTGHDYDSRMTESAAAVYDILGVLPARAEILRIALEADEVTAIELMELLGLTRNGVGKHLKVLTAAGLLLERRATHPRGTGGVICWRADRDAIEAALDELRAKVLSIPDA